MGSGYFGGLFARAIGDRLRAKYGKSKTNALAGVIALIICFFLMVIFTRYYPAIYEGDLQPVTINSPTIQLNDVGRSKELQIKFMGHTFTASNGLWKNYNLTDDDMLRVIRNGGRVTIWTVPPNGNIIFGLEFSNLTIPKSIGLELYSTNRQVLLWLSISFGLAGLIAIGYSILKG